ncbi:hypothetical protein BRADI_5g19831v3 [Brachypodium distachyon]|uniref:Uncharacterized protein n=1 Tax=Brachypodium distachyon TaxID=15368 RepID=A0A0Q3ECZ9_BRADI|nr:hypothetical protein BRADI_5g19831v3 [Brachypodium distachyon]
MASCTMEAGAEGPPNVEDVAELRVTIYKLTIRVRRFVAKLDDGSKRPFENQDLEFQINIRRFSVENLIELLWSKIVWGGRQEVQIFCLDKHFGTLERLNTYWKMLTAIHDRWQEKKYLF